MSQGSPRYEVGVLGAGAVGCSIAYHLARRKIAPVVLDREGAGAPADAASGEVWVQSRRSSVHARLGLGCADRFPLLQEAIGPIEYLRTGGLDPAFDEEEAQAGVARAQRQAAAGIDVRWLSREEVLRREPALSPAILGASYSPHDGSVNPFLLVRRLVSAARRYGAEFFLHCGHVAVQPLARGFLLRSGRGEIEVRRLVIAADPWMHETPRALTLGMEIPLRTVSSHTLVSEPVAPLLRHTIAGARQQITGEVLLGGACAEAGVDVETPLEPMRRVARDGVRLVPAFHSVRVIRTFTSVESVPVDDLPILSDIPEFEGLYVAAAPQGIGLCPLVGDAMAGLVAGGGPLLGDLQSCGLQRFQPSGMPHAPARQDSLKNL